jgi:hypothetical protein
MTTVEVLWRGPWVIRPEELGKEATPACFEDDAFDGCGLYAIYGTHVVFGRHALLYIGRADKFRTRMTTHWKQWLLHAQEPTIHLGVIEKPTKLIGDETLLAAVEALTIWWHSPPYNSTNIQSWAINQKLARNKGLAAAYPNLEVQNDGQIGTLNWMYSTYWYNKRGARPEDNE